MNKNTNIDADTANPDAITGAPGSHPLGSGIGAASAGAAGAAIGSVGGPVGAAVGAVVGAVAGGLAGKGIAEAVNPTAEDQYWQSAYQSRPYYSTGIGYDEFQPAYRSGWEGRTRYAGSRFEDVESELRSDWQAMKGHSKLDWSRARSAARDAWERIDSRNKDGSREAKGR